MTSLIRWFGSSKLKISVLITLMRLIKVQIKTASSSEIKDHTKMTSQHSWLDQLNYEPHVSIQPLSHLYDYFQSPLSLCINNINKLIILVKASTYHQSTLAYLYIHIEKYNFILEICNHGSGKHAHH